MSIVARFVPKSPATTEQYDKGIRRFEEAGDFPPDGMEYHVAFVVDGNVRVSEIWDSREQLEAFGQRLMPVLDELGIVPGEPEIYEVHNIVRR
jgi:hypothetical protein